MFALIDVGVNTACSGVTGAAADALAVRRSDTYIHSVYFSLAATTQAWEGLALRRLKHDTHSMNETGIGLHYNIC